MNSFYHAGEIGDLVYGLYTMRKLGGGDLWLGAQGTPGLPQPRGFTREIYENVRAFCEQLPYVRGVWWYDGAGVPPVTHDLNTFRGYWRGLLPAIPGREPTLVEMQAMAFGVTYDANEPWLDVRARRVAPVVIAHSARHPNWHFPWKRLCEKYAGQSVFIGHVDEHRQFCEKHGVKVPRTETGLLLDVAAAIAGADLFVGNPSAPLAIAEGLKKQVRLVMCEDCFYDSHVGGKRDGLTIWRNEADWREELC